MGVPGPKRTLLMTGFLPLRSTLKLGFSESPSLVMGLPLDSIVAFSVCFSVTSPVR